MSQSYKTAGLLLRRHDYSEYDRLHVFLTPIGKLTGVARGVRKPKAKLAAHLQPFAELELMLVRGHKADIITSARIVQAYRLEDDYQRLRRGFLFLEMADKLTDTEDTERQFKLLGQHLAALTEYDPPLCELAFKLQLLESLGQVPRLRRDGRGQPLQIGTDYRFDPAHGVLQTGNTVGLSLSNDAIKLWRLLLAQPLTQVAKLPSAAAVSSTSLPVIDAFIEEQFGVRFKSAEL